MVLSNSAQAGRHKAGRRPTTSIGWLRLLPTTGAGTVSVQFLDVMLLGTVNINTFQAPLGRGYRVPSFAAVNVRMGHAIRIPVGLTYKRCFNGL